MKKIKFVLGIHNHQPIGNFDFVFEEAFQKSYRPFLEVLENHPLIKISIHFTGILLDWIEHNHPELITLIRKLRKNGQLEIMTGGYYEPIISVIPRRDRISQIKKLTIRIKELFEYDATGMWLAERVWEPTLPSTLYDADIKYTCVDDTHFKYAGLNDEDLDGYFVSEDIGKPVFLFPISKQLRYTIPFQEPQETINVLRKLASEDEDRVLVFADDGEKFGVWPGTYDHVYQNKWLDRFFSAIEENLDWIEMITFDQAVNQLKPKSTIYLPTASYAEMMHWSLFKDAFKKYERFEHYLQEQNVYEENSVFVRGGFWRNFMTKYPEINVMHKKMLRVSDKVNSMKIADNSEAKNALLAAQCNCPYWHGVFGGLYLSHLRFAIFSNLIKAEKILTAENPSILKELEKSDFDRDGRIEVLIETPVHNAYFKPSAGGNMFLYDFKASEKNLLDTMSRREEGYHDKLYNARVAGSYSDKGAVSIHGDLEMKEAGLEKYLIYDSYERKSLIDHILETDSDVEKFYKNEYVESGNFFKAEYQVENSSVHKDRIRLSLSCQGTITQRGEKYPVKILKVIDVMRDTEEVSIKYQLTNLSAESLRFKFASEFNFGLQAGHAPDRYYYNQQGRLPDSFLDSRGSLEKQSFIGLKDEYMRIDVQLTAKDPDSIWYLPVETISQSEAGFEKVYQSSCILVVWETELQKTKEFNISQKINTF
jgi:alpha-amylase